MMSYAIIGASRGIGLEYVRQLATQPHTTVFAIVRSAAKSTTLEAATRGLHNVHILQADDAAKQVSELTGGKLDCLIHNAARTEADSVFKGFDDFTSMDELDADFITSFRVNSLGVIHSISAFLPLLRAGPTKKIVVISTAGADLKTVLAIGKADMAAYGMTKAAALIATTKWAVKLQHEGFIVVSVSPGRIDDTGDTDHAVASQSNATILPKADPFAVMTLQESVSTQLRLIDRLKPSDNGLFLAHTGGEYRWEVTGQR
ncbi:NAD-P-binding protein [Lentinus tigrinus ALCF2SS1-6]|uniref:NAD-P-binding protein n=1 Tax=Lentinus tigrinus ALCF2SS1-6 TaxID=1328759 RepID=A0A5C2RU09_9APHY|nr:NAD-P-binding protein [Lentinus tigrinus ALCF2SS1-6]